jgi:cell division protein FtsQ
VSPVARQAAYLKKKETFSISYGWLNRFIPVLIICAVLFVAQDHLSNPNTLPVTKIRVHGVFVNVDEEMLHRAIDGVIAGGYFNIDVERVRGVVETLPWVQEASVRRVWPDTLSVSVIEQQPVAISKQAGLINAQGNIFKPANKLMPTSLPVFDGDVSLSKLMLSKYYEMSAQLNRQNLKITYLNIDMRHAVKLKLNNGLSIILGRGETMYKLERFMSIYAKSLSSYVNDIESVDLRYTNGMAIAWKEKMNNNKAALGDMKHV